jgi:alpha-ketoglutarate-dependent taurine dioxygenase
MVAHPQARDLIPAFGAEIVGVDPGTWFDADTIRFLREVFDDRGLLLFRDVEVDRPHQFYLSELLRGHEPPTVEEAEAGAAAQGKFVISNKEPDAAAPIGRLLFHSDGMWSDEPFEVLSLCSVEVPPPVIPTLFASSAYGWDTLAGEMRARVDGLHGLHVTGPEYIHERRRRAYEGELSTPKRDHVPLITAPIENRHPRTDRALLYVSQGMTREIMELGSEESEDLLEELFEHLYCTEHVYEHEWCEGDLIVWDNFAVQHGRPNVVLDGPPRTLRKIGLPVPSSVETQLVKTYARVS